MYTGGSEKSGFKGGTHVDDGVILSNVLDVMPKDISTTVIDDLERVPEDSKQEAGY